MPFFIPSISRKRGPITGAGFLCIKDEDTLRKFLTSCPSQVPFLEGTTQKKTARVASFHACTVFTTFCLFLLADETENQPDVEMAPNQRCLKTVRTLVFPRRPWPSWHRPPRSRASRASSSSILPAGPAGQGRGDARGRSGVFAGAPSPSRGLSQTVFTTHPSRASSTAHVGAAALGRPPVRGEARTAGAEAAVGRHRLRAEGTDVLSPEATSRPRCPHSPPLPPLPVHGGLPCGLRRRSRRSTTATSR